MPDFSLPVSLPGNIFNAKLGVPTPAGLDPSFDPNNLPHTIDPFPSVTKNGGGFSIGNIAQNILKGGEDQLAYLDKKINNAARPDTTLYPTILGFAHIIFEDDKVFEITFPILETVLDNNGHKEADILELTWNFNDVPFDPRQVKEMICSLYVGYQEDLLSPTTAQQADAVFQKSKLRQMFEGYADEYHIEWKDTGYEAKAKCRDYTALMIDLKIQDGNFKDIRGTDKFTDVVKNLAKTFKFNVMFSKGLEATCPTIQKYFDDKDHRLVEEHTSYWDVICKMAEMIGCIAFVTGRNLYFGDPDPFKVYETLYDDTHESLEFVWGLNIQELEIRRKFNTNYQYTNVEVRGYDAKKGKPIYVTWPDPPVQKAIRMVGGSFSSEVVHGKAGQGPLPQYATAHQQKNHQEVVKDGKGRVVKDTLGHVVTKTVSDIPKQVTRATDGLGGGKVTSLSEKEKRVQQNYIVYAPMYCKDEKILKEIARSAWNNLHRMEIEGRMKIQGHSDMMAGNCFQISLSPTHIKLLATYRSVPAMAEALKKRGYNKGTAEQLATFIIQEENRWWYILGAKHRYSDGSGYECEVDFISFVNFDAIIKGGNTATQRGSAPGGRAGGRNSKAASSYDGGKPPIPAGKGKSGKNVQSRPAGNNNHHGIPAHIQSLITNTNIDGFGGTQGANYGPLNGKTAESLKPTVQDIQNIKDFFSGS
jgi:hypothetical protein